MQALLLYAPNTPLQLKTVPIPEPEHDEILVEVEACGVCRTDLHIVEGDLPMQHSPCIPGHQIVGRIVKTGSSVLDKQPGDRVGIPWLASTCGSCKYCKKGKENLCSDARFTGYHVPGGYAEYTKCKSSYAVALPERVSAEELAPLLCAGIIGFRAYLALQGAETIAFFGFGSSAHILLQIAVRDKKRVFVFTRKEDLEGKAFAKELGAFWVGDSEESPPEPPEGAIIFAPAGELMVRALRILDKGGICVSAGIHMTDIPSFPYKDLFLEKILTCVSHVNRADEARFFSSLSDFLPKTRVHIYPLQEANKALQELKEGKKKGSFVLQIRSQPNKAELKESR